MTKKTDEELAGDIASLENQLFMAVKAAKNAGLSVSYEAEIRNSAYFPVFIVARHTTLKSKAK